MGISIYQYVLGEKMEHVADLLINTENSLLDIALTTGFNDVRNVYRIFKRYMGYTPIEYRSKHQNYVNKE